MDSSRFFGYPDGDAKPAVHEHVFLPDLGEEAWDRLLGYAQMCSFPAGAVIIQQGQAERALYIVAEGTLEVVGGPAGRAPKRLSLVESGCVFGELAFFDGRPRSATVRAVTPTRLYQLGVDAFEALGARDPQLARDVLLDLGRIVCVRLRAAEATVAAWVK